MKRWGKTLTFNLKSNLTTGLASIKLESLQSAVRRKWHVVENAFEEKFYNKI